MASSIEVVLNKKLLNKFLWETGEQFFGITKRTRRDLDSEWVFLPHDHLAVYM